MNLSELAEALGCRLEGDRAIEIVRVAGIDQAQGGDITFVDNPRYIPRLASTNASAVIVAEDLAIPAGARFAVLRSAHPYVDFARAVALFLPSSAPAKGIDRLSAIAQSATIGADVSIGPFVTVAAGASIGARTVLYPHAAIGPGAIVGDDCVIHSQCSIRERAVVGNRVILHDGVVVGSEGFGFAKQADGTHLKIPQGAGIVIEDDVDRREQHDHRPAVERREFKPARKSTTWCTLPTASASGGACCSPRKSASPEAPSSKTT
jgi:UDP-3-O-[3-hydroxymyristoyl] glucosamine N-acyltransferase